MSETAVPPKRRGVVAVVVRDHRLLVVRRSQQVVAPGTYCFPGGGIEDGESETEALIRELREELGVIVHPIRCLWECTTSWGVWLAWWYSGLAPDQELIPDLAEVESVAWYTPAEMAALPGLLESNRAFLEAVTAGQIRLEV